MICYTANTLKEYLDRLAAREPVPGGGSAAALSGALGAALLEMVARYSLDKGKSAMVEQELQTLLARAAQARTAFLSMVSEDSQAYQAMREAKKLGEDAYRQACAAAAEPPRRVQAESEICLTLAAYLRAEGNPRLLSDVIAAEALLRAAMAGAGAMIAEAS